MEARKRRSAFASAMVSEQGKLTKQHRRVLVPAADLAQGTIIVHPERSHLDHPARQTLLALACRVPASSQLTLHQSWSSQDRR